MSVAVLGSAFGFVLAVVVYVCAATLRAARHAADEL